jgi:hypothetical protein
MKALVENYELNSALKTVLLVMQLGGSKRLLLVASIEGIKNITTTFFFFFGGTGV